MSLLKYVSAVLGIVGTCVSNAIPKPVDTYTYTENPGYVIERVVEPIKEMADIIREMADGYADSKDKSEKFNEQAELANSITAPYYERPKRDDARMKPIDVGKIKVTPFEFESILEINIQQEINEHSTLYVCGIIKDDMQVKPVTEMMEGANVKCENDGQTYFNGVLQNVKITCADKVYRLEVQAISNTALLDTAKQRRSFQDNDQTYEEIVKTVIKGQSGSVAYNASEMKVKNIILQYNETDWAFAKRLASHTQDVLIPITSDKPAFHFGAPDKGGAKLEASDFTISKDFNAFRRMASEEQPLTAEDVTIYTVETDDLICELGERLNLNGNDLLVRRIAISLINSALSIVYTLSAKKAVSAPMIFNRAITGLVLGGTVFKAEGDNVKLQLDIDNEKYEDRAHLFKYATGYSAEKHTGWYVMPEEGDTVQLMFPNEDEKNAYAVSSIRQKDTEKTSDPSVKYWRTAFGKEIKMDEREILITSKDDETLIRINEETGIEIITPNPVLIQSGAAVNIESKDDMTFLTEKNLFVQAKDSIEMACGGNVMKFVPSKGISISTDKKLEIVSKDNATIDGKKEVGIKSGKDLKLDGGGKLAGSGKTKIELSSGGSSVMLASGGVDIKGTMIREN